MMDSIWHIDLLSGLRARGAERTITRFRTQKSGLLLAYLALHRSRAHPRDVLAAMLWLESDGAGGRLNLRVELASLRRQLEPPGIPHGVVLMTDYAAVQLNPAAVHTDVAAFEAALQEAKRAADPARRIVLLRGAVDRYRGELLPGCVEEWAFLERGRLADLYRAALRELSGLLHASGDPEAAIEAAHRAVAADPLGQEARFDLIRLYAALPGQPMPWPSPANSGR